MINFLRTHKLSSAGVGVAVIAGLAWLAFGYFGVHLLFVDDVVDEAVPTFDQPRPEAAATSAPSTVPSPASLAGDTDDVAIQTENTIGSETPAVSTGTVAPDPAVAEIVVESSGSFIDGDHPTSGVASVLGNGTGQRFLRFEEFATDNGPDLNVYLVNSSTGDVSDSIDLGDLNGNIGDQNYEIPEGVDLDVYDQVVIWCVRFGVGFGSAQLS